MMDIQRLIAPRTMALIGASAWTDAVAAGNRVLGFQGTIWRVHPTRLSTPTTHFYRSVADLPHAPDSAFIAVPKEEAPGVAGALAARGSGGFVCFSAGFSETGSDVGLRLTQDLLQQAKDLPFFGPNCYGFVNFFDGAAMLPDQVVGSKIERGVALICQSGTIALTLMFNDRSLPIGCLFSVGNQTRLAVEDLIEILSEDTRITAFGLYLEGIKDPEKLARASDKARSKGKPIAVIKSGRTAAAARTAHSHTGALAGEDSVFESFCRQSGMARCDTLSTLCETLKVFHVGGALGGKKILIMGASGGDMAMTADVSRALDLDFTPIPDDRASLLRELLSDRVTIANPLDIHTYLWFDPKALGKVFSTALRSGFDAVGFMLDSPPEARSDISSYHAVIDEFIAAAQPATESDHPSRAALVASLPETLSPTVRARCYDQGVVPLQGQREALESLALAVAAGTAWRTEPAVELHVPRRSAEGEAAFRIPASDATRIQILTEFEGKKVLAAHGVRVPIGSVVPASEVADAAARVGFPVVVKAVGAHLEHKTEMGGVVLNVCSPAEALAAGERLAPLSSELLVEAMTTDGVAEILVGILVDPQFGQILVLAAGGIFTELLADSVTLLPPWTRDSIGRGLERLKIAKLLNGHRGNAAGDVPELIACILGIARYAAANRARIVEIDVNPIIVRPYGKGVVAVDTLIRLRKFG